MIMIAKILQRIKFYSSIRYFEYLKLNYFSKNIIRIDNSRIIPYKNSVIDIYKTARIYIGGGDIEIGCDSLKGSKTETLIRLRKNARWTNEGGCRISYGATVEVLQNALFDTQFFTINSKSVIISASNIHFGNDVMIGRNAVIYDSDHHAILKNGETSNFDLPIHIGDHVWIATNAVVLKGTTIGCNSIVAANAVATGNIPDNTLFQTEKTSKLRKNYGIWDRKHP